MKWWTSQKKTCAYCAVHRTYAPLAYTHILNVRMKHTCDIHHCARIYVLYSTRNSRHETLFSAHQRRDVRMRENHMIGECGAQTHSLSRRLTLTFDKHTQTHAHTIILSSFMAYHLRGKPLWLDYYYYCYKHHVTNKYNSWMRKKKHQPKQTTTTAHKTEETRSRKKPLFVVVKSRTEFIYKNGSAFQRNETDSVS